MVLEKKGRKKRMAFSPDKENQHSASWFRSKKALKNVLFAMGRSKPLTPNNQMQRPPASPHTHKIHNFTPIHLVLDKTSILSDEILLEILSKLPESQRNANSLVCKRWLDLQGRLVRSIKLLDWHFLISGRLFLRFPNLVHVDLVNGCLITPENSGVTVTNRVLYFNGGSDSKDCFIPESYVLSGDEVDSGLRVLASGFPNLRKLAVMNATEMGLLSVGEECSTLQELELRMCNDHVLRGIAACRNLQILMLTGVQDGSYGYSVSDVGLTILGQGCKGLMKLELSGCGGSFEGIKAIGQCCSLLEELTISNHDMEDGWLLALLFCENLKRLRLVSCKRIDGGFSLDEDSGCCLTGIESLHLEKCQMRDMKSSRALFLISQNARRVVLHNCWGLSDDIFTTATALRRASSLSIEGCSLLTTQGLESVIVSWNELKSLKVRSCNNIRDEEINPALLQVFAALKDLKWEPDPRSRLASCLAGTEVGKRGGKFFNKSCDWGREAVSQMLEYHT